MFIKGRVRTDLYHTLPHKTRDDLLRLADRLASRAQRRGRERALRAMRSVPSMTHREEMQS